MFLALFLPLQILTAAPDERVFGLDTQMVIHIIAQAINVSLLTVLMVYLLYRPVQNFLRKRSEKIKSQIDQAALDMATADALRSQYKENLAHIEQERTEILDSAQKTAAEKSRKIVQAGQVQAEGAYSQALLDIEKEKARVQDALRLQVIALSSVMAGKIVAHGMDQETQDRLFDEALAELESTPWPG